MNVVNIEKKLGLFSEHWSPKILASCNGQLVKIAKVKGEFIWHDHKDEDELFLVLRGKLLIDFEDETIELNPGELVVVPRGTRHRPRTNGEETAILLFEPQSTTNTGEVKNEKTVESPDYI